MALARANIEPEAWTDPAFALLARYLGLPDRDVALIRCAKLWAWQTAEYSPDDPHYVVSSEVIETFLGVTDAASAMVKAGLAVEEPDGFLIRGSRGRIEWLWNLQENGKKGGEATKRKHGQQQKRKRSSKTGPPGPALPPAQPGLFDLDLSIPEREREPGARARDPVVPSAATAAYMAPEHPTCAERSQRSDVNPPLQPVRSAANSPTRNDAHDTTCAECIRHPDLLVAGQPVRSAASAPTNVFHRDLKPPNVATCAERSQLSDEAVRLEPPVRSAASAPTHSISAAIGDRDLKPANVISLDPRARAREQILREIPRLHAEAFNRARDELALDVRPMHVLGDPAERALQDLLDQLPVLDGVLDDCKHVIAIRYAEAIHAVKTVQYLGASMWKRDNFAKAKSLSVDEAKRVRAGPAASTPNGPRPARATGLTALLDGIKNHGGTT